MVRETILYTCDLCQKEYHSEHEASCCEKEHYQPVSVSSANSLVIFKFNDNGIPNVVKINLENKDGDKITKVYELK